MKEDKTINNSESDLDTSDVSRRKFLKMLGGGAAIAGATAFLPSAASFNISSDKGLKYFNKSSSSSAFNVDPSGNLETGSLALSSDHGPSNGLRIEKRDLSSLSLDSSFHNYIFHHDGTGEISLADSSTTSASGLYIWDNNNSAWVPTQQDAISLGGYSADQFAKKAGETFTDTLTVQQETGNSLLQILTSKASSDEPVLHLGGDQTKGLRLKYNPGAETWQIGNFQNDSFSPVMEFDLNGNLLDFKASEILFPEKITADAEGASKSVIQALTTTEATESNSGELRVGADSNNHSFFRWDPNGGFGRLGSINNGNEETHILMDDEGYWINIYALELDLKEADLVNIAKYSDHTQAPVDSIYYHDTDGLTYKISDTQVSLLQSSTKSI